MDNFYVKGNIILLTAFLPVLFGLLRYRVLDRGSRIFFYISVLGLVTESLAYYMAHKYRDNLVVYNLSNIFELFMVCLYFNYTIKSFGKRHIGWIIGIIAVLVGFINDFYIQSIHGITDVFLLFHALVAISLSIFSLLSFMQPDDTRQVKQEVHFWFPVIQIFSWSFTYLLFSLIGFYAARLKTTAPQVILALFLVDVITNLAIATIFILYPKMRAHV